MADAFVSVLDQATADPARAVGDIASPSAGGGAAGPVRLEPATLLDAFKDTCRGADADLLALVTDGRELT